MSGSELQRLHEAIDKIDKISDASWLSSLDKRKLDELAFHNRDRDVSFRKEADASADTYEKFYGNRKYYKSVERSRQYMKNWIAENARDRIFLDYACGNGSNAIEAARSGAKIALGLDISDVSINNCRVFAQAAGLEGNTRFFQADAENTLLPDNSIDTIICSGMLHHLDLALAFPELRRILKPGGKILAAEALDYNPAIKLYRRLTPTMRTEWEKAHILGMKDLDFAGRFFDLREVKYWHVVGYIGGKFGSLLTVLDAMDRVLESIPLINRLAWIFTFELYKPLD
jgi:SAM-dependent methyltransferase